jgi:phage shock protein A
MEEWFLNILLTVLLIFFFSKSIYYRSLYEKSLEEKAMAEGKTSSLDSLVQKYDKQVKNSIKNLDQLQDSYRALKDKQKALNKEKSALEFKNRKLEEKISLLYAQIESTE